MDRASLSADTPSPPLPRPWARIESRTGQIRPRTHMEDQGRLEDHSRPHAPGTSPQARMLTANIRLLEANEPAAAAHARGEEMQQRPAKSCGPAQHRPSVRGGGLHAANYTAETMRRSLARPREEKGLPSSWTAGTTWVACDGGRKWTPSLF